MPNAYFLGPHPCAALTALATPGVTPPSIPHCSASPDGTQCLCQADFQQSVLDAPPVGYVFETLAEAHAQRVAWSITYPLPGAGG